jgi:hypothetical protein
MFSLRSTFVSCKRGVAAQKLPVKLNLSLLEISKHNLYYIMKQSEIKDLSAAELQENLARLRKHMLT